MVPGVLAHSVHFRISDSMYERLVEEAEAEGVSVSHFARESTLIRAAIYANRRGMRWTNSEEWEKLARVADRIDYEDSRRRAKAARERRNS